MRKDLHYEWTRDEVPRLRNSPAAFFAVDDSEVVIASSKDTLLAALSFYGPAEVVDRMASLRAELSLPPDFEFKCNQQGLASELRVKVADGFRQILGQLLGVFLGVRAVNFVWLHLRNEAREFGRKGVSVTL